MRTYELIQRKRDGGRLTAAEIQAFISGYASDAIPDYQAAAMAMAIFFRGLDEEELATWTKAMLESGDVLDLSDVPGFKVDKHSTGGVGDKISIPLVPLVVACGARVPMMAGRGLGHTGGTLDKLESIAGFRVDLEVEAFRRQVGQLGMALIGQTDRLAPADRKLYALRDATATVESIPLIASSIMSKKLAEGSDGLVLDVKVGRGAFMRDIDQARRLAATMVDIGKRMGRRMVAVLTDMNEPLGRTVGNALEIVESIEILQGRGPGDTTALTVELGAEMLLLGGLATDLEDGRRRMRTAIADGSGLAAFRKLVEAQGGDVRMIDDPSRLPRAPHVVEVRARRTGFIEGVHAEEVGHASVLLGAGRAKKGDAIDPAVGFVFERRRGDRVEAGQVIALAHVRDPTAARPALDRFAAAFSYADTAPAERPLFLDRII